MKHSQPMLLSISTVHKSAGLGSLYTIPPVARILDGALYGDPLTTTFVEVKVLHLAFGTDGETRGRL